MCFYKFQNWANYLSLCLKNRIFPIQFYSWTNHASLIHVMWLTNLCATFCHLNLECLTWYMKIHSHILIQSLSEYICFPVELFNLYNWYFLHPDKNPTLVLLFSRKAWAFSQNYASIQLKNNNFWRLLVSILHTADQFPLWPDTMCLWHQTWIYYNIPSLLFVKHKISCVSLNFFQNAFQHSELESYLSFKQSIARPIPVKDFTILPTTFNIFAIHYA